MVEQIYETKPINLQKHLDKHIKILYNKGVKRMKNRCIRGVLLAVVVAFVSSGMYLTIKAYHKKQEVQNKQEQETVMQQKAEEPYELVIPKQNNFGKVTIMGVDRVTGETLAQTYAEGIVKILNNGRNGEPIEVVVYANTAE